MSTLAYLKSFFKDKDVASVTPTSTTCIRHVCKPINFSEDIKVIEYGAGAGIFAKYLLEKMSDDSTLAMFETNERLFDKLQKIGDSRAQCYNKSVEYVDEALDQPTAKSVDYVISGIPFSFLDVPTRKKVLNKTKRILKPGGKFLAYQTSSHLKEPLKNTFGNVHTEWEWLNIPPMTIYKAVKE